LKLNGLDIPLNYYYRIKVSADTFDNVNKPVNFPIKHPLLLGSNDSYIFSRDEPDPPNEMKYLPLFALSTGVTLGPICLQRGTVPYRMFRQSGSYKAVITTPYKDTTLGTISWTGYYPNNVESRGFNDLKIKIASGFGESVWFKENSQRSIVSSDGSPLKILSDGELQYIVSMNIPDEVRLNQTPFLDDLTITILIKPRWLVYW
jgi:hypothetical protein